MGKKIVFFDVDNTVWDHNMQIPESTARAITMLKEKGNLAFINTGRARANINDSRLLGLGFDGIVAACGAYIEMNGKEVFNYLLPDDVVRLTVDTITEHQMPVVLEGPYKHWISSHGFMEDDFVRYLFRSMGDKACYLEESTDKILINKFSADVLKRTDYKMIKQILLPYYDFIEHGITADLTDNPETSPDHIISVIEAVPKGFSKGSGIKWLCEYLNVDIADTYAIGDSANDYEMLKMAGHSIAMGNGTEQVRKMCEYVTTDIHNDGVYNALMHYGLI